jgi:hypothetical protein
MEQTPKYFIYLFGYIEPAISLGAGVAAIFFPKSFAKRFLPFRSKTLANFEKESNYLVQYFGAMCIFACGSLYAVFGSGIPVPQKVQKIFLLFAMCGDLAILFATAKALSNVPKSEWSWKSIHSTATFSLVVGISRVIFLLS